MVICGRFLVADPLVLARRVVLVLARLAGVLVFAGTSRQSPQEYLAHPIHPYEQFVYQLQTNVP